MISEKSTNLLGFLKIRFPDAKCALDFKNDFECLVSIILSAQTTDASVNKVTPKLFFKYPTALELSKADLYDAENIIKSIGLYKNKARNIIATAKELANRFNGMVPNDFGTLVSLPGVGTKTAGVYLIERGDRPAIPVDTHVSRIAYRLRYCDSNDQPIEIERKLEKSFPKEDWIFVHHSLIWFGRRICHAKNPECNECPLGKYCRYFKYNSSTMGK